MMRVCVCCPTRLGPQTSDARGFGVFPSTSAGVTDRVIAQLMRHNMEDVFEELVRLYADPA